MSQKPYVYTFIRKDISKEQQIVQTAHATLQAGFVFEMPAEISNLVLLEVENEAELKMISEKLYEIGICHYMFFEPDNDMGFSAIATRPVFEKKERNFFSKWKLFKSQCSCSVNSGNNERPLGFFEKFISDQKPLPPEFQKVLNDNFWELLET